jgi:DNA-binding transcriptional regulator LsrR (DeoR family)
MARVDELRLMTRVARLYYEQGSRQPEIAATLGLSQATISRLLQRAQREGIVRITVNVPSGAYPELEEELERRYGLREAIVADCAADEESQILRDVGSAAAYYLQTPIQRGEVIGISSWSTSLLAMVDALAPLGGRTAERVVQILGGGGDPAAEGHAAHLVRRLSSLVRGEPTFLPAPGLVGQAETRRILLGDPFVRQALAWFGRVTLALVGIGTIQPSHLLVQSGNAYTPEEAAELERCGAVGDICLHFFDAHGRPVDTALDERVVGMTLDELAHVPRTVAVAGGRRKVAAIRAALAGRLINVLVTDHFTARRLLETESTSIDQE